MQPLFYHDHRTRSGPQWARWAVAVAVCGATVSACGRPAPPPGAATPTTATPPSLAPTADSAATTPTAAAIASGRAVIDRLRTAGGGPALAALKSFEATGTSQMTGMKVVRRLKISAMFPQFYRQEESMPAAVKGPVFNTTIGLEGDIGWLTGAILGGDAQSKNIETSRRIFARAARQAMAGLIAGVSAPWLVDTGKYTVTDGGVINAGPDRGALILIMDGPDGRVGRLLIDPDTHLPRRLIQPPQPGGGGTAAIADIVFTYSDYQPQAGLQLPHTIIRENGRTRTAWSITQYTLNPKLTPRQFSRVRR
ncbi:MAG: hypothetical protein WCQ64_09800 [Acidobacteriota bacterium]